MPETEPQKPDSQSPVRNDPVFIVGCPRSGTTVLQALIATNFKLFAFPETQLPYRFFHDIRWPIRIGESRLQRALRASWSMANRIGLCRMDSAELLRKAENFAFQVSAGPPLRRRFLLKSAASDYRAMIARHANGRRWLDKSPLNILCLPYIDSYFEEASIVHIFRNPVDVVASLVVASRKHRPFRRYSGQDGWKLALELWQRCAKATLDSRTKESHIFINYDAMTEDPNKCLAVLAKFLKTEFCTAGTKLDLATVAHSDEAWKFERGAEIKKLKSRAMETLGAAKVRQIRDRTHNLHKELESIAR